MGARPLPTLQTTEAVPASEVRETGTISRFRFAAKLWINENSETDRSRESRDIACLLNEQSTGQFQVCVLSISQQRAGKQLERDIGWSNG